MPASLPTGRSWAVAGEWIEVPIGQLAEIFDGPHATPPKTSDGPLFLGISNLAQGRLDLSNTEHLSEDDYKRWTRRVEPEAGDVVFSYETRLGEAALIPPGLRCCLGRRMGLLRARTGKVHRRFLLYAYLGPQFQETLRSRMIHGSAVDRIPLIDMPGFPIKVPESLAEQRAIAHILGTLDDKIELNRRMSETLEAIARALFKSWFVDFDPVRAKSEGRDPGLRQPFADLFPDSFEDSELGEIPKGWRVGELGDVADHPRRGVQPNEIEPSTPYIALEHMPRHSITLREWEIADGVVSNKFVFRRGEVLFGKLRPYFHKVGVAPIDGVCSTDIAVVKPRQEDWFGFVLGHVSSEAFVEYANAGSTGTKMPRTGWGDMARYPVALPPELLARAFDARVRPLVTRLVAGIHEGRTLAALRDTLLPKLVSGELRVKDAEHFGSEVA
jgi:type I restriction enzyme S subunit